MLDDHTSLFDQKRSRWQMRRPKGWRFGVSCAAIGCLTVFLANTIIAILAVSGWESKDGIFTVHEGTCHIVDRWSISLHGLINVMSSLLFAGSNYTSQCLASPTRKEVDDAHAKRHWLEIGIPSFSNISGRVSPRKSILWSMLSLTSIPIHLVYNSVIFKTVATSEYDVVVASQGFFSGGNVSSSIDIWCNSSYREDQRCYVWNKETAGSTNLEAWCSSLNLIHEDCQCRTTYNQSDRELSAHCKVFDPVGFTNQCLETDARQALEGCRSKNAAHISEFRSLLYNKFPEGSLIQVQNLTSHECIEAYDRNFVDTRGPVVLITKDGTSSANDTFISMKTISGYRSSSTAQSWICEDDQTCGMSTAELTSDEWTVSNHTIDHCVSMEVPPRCRLQMSMHVLVAVIICNAIKFLVMISTLLFSEPTLVTMGDAIASFLNTPDPQSKNQEFIGRHDLLHSTAPALCFGMRAASPGRHPLSAKQRWSAAVTNDRWIVTLSLWLILLGTASGLLVRATQTIRQKSATNPFARGFGTLDTDATFNLQGQSTFEDTPPPEEIAAVIGTILLVNTPQIVATFLYFTYNAHLTAMVGSAEWSTFYLRHRPLRVSDPHGQQRSTYFLQLPFRYSLPLLFAGMALHWLISQSLFLARVNAVRYRVDGTFTESETMTQLGYSCTPLLLAVLLGGFLLLAIVGISFRTLPGHMPVVGSCSLAIAGACHRPKDDAGAALLPVAWGEVAEFEDEEGVASRCCFTSKEVVSPHGLPRQLNHKPRRHERFKRAKRGCSRESPLDTELTDLVHVS